MWWALDSLANLPDLATIVILYLGVVSAFAGWGFWVHHQPFPYRALGLQWSPRFRWELLLGGTIATISGFLPPIAEAFLGWLVWVPVEPDVLLPAIVNAIATALAVGFAEELLFRGWLLEELRLDCPDWLAAAIATSIFAIVHQWGWQLVGLLIVGTILVRAKYLTGNRLGLSMGLHAGWVFSVSAINIANWIEYTDVVPNWITGIDGNPLAGLVGWLTLLVTLAMLEFGLRSIRSKSFQ